MTTQLSPYLLSPDIDLTSEETQWECVELIYQQMAFDEFQFTDRGKYFAVKYLLENRKWPVYFAWTSRINRWHWFPEAQKELPRHSIIFPTGWIARNFGVNNIFGLGHDTFGESILWFCSLWTRFYVECVLPTQENEPANAEEFWENLNLCLPGEDWRKKFCPIYFDEDYYVVQWFDVCGDVLQRMDELRDKFDRDPHYCWNWGNAAIRAVKAWKGE